MRNKKGQFVSDSEKSYVGLETNICIVCGKEFDTGALFMDKRLRNTLDRHNCTGWGMCEEHQKLYDDGYVALVEIDPAASTPSKNNTVKPEDAFRTGAVIHMRNEVYDDMFNLPLPEKGIAFIDPEVMEIIKARMPQGESNDENSND